jgi:hypothetical protein
MSRIYMLYRWVGTSEVDLAMIHRQTLDRQTLDTTNPGQDKPWTRQTLDSIGLGAY